MAEYRRGDVVLVRFPFTDFRDERHPSFPQTGLKRSSVAKGEKVAVIHRSIIRATIGSLDPTLLDALAQRVKTALQLS